MRSPGSWVVSLAALGALAASGCGGELRASGRWTQLQSDHFRLLTDVDPALAAREVPRLESALAGIGARVRSDHPAPPRIDVLWLHNRDAVAALGVDDARGYYLPHQGDEPSTPPLVVVAGDPGRDVEQALVHELAHVVFVDAAPAAPAWLAEGMAAFWDTLDIDGRNVGFDEAEQSTAMLSNHIRTSGRLVRLYSLEQLLRADYTPFHHSRLSGYSYAAARAFVAMLLTAPELAARLDGYIAALHRGTDAERAWRDSFAGITVAELQSRYDRFFVAERRPLPLEPWRGSLVSHPEAPPAVERWFARARPWESRVALDEAGRALARAAADDSAERHYWSGIYAAATQRFAEATGELRAALARDPALRAAASALARVEARTRAAR